MLLSDIRDEFVFHCQTRKLSPRTIRNYEKQIDYPLRFLHNEHGISVISDVNPRHVREFLLTMSRAGRSTNYVNDLLKAFKHRKRRHSNYANAYQRNRPHSIPPRSCGLTPRYLDKQTKLPARRFVN